METLFSVVDALTDAAADLAQRRAGLRQMVEAVAGHAAWRLLHYLTDLKTWVLALAPVLLLEHWWPARPRSAGGWRHLAHDWGYPLFVIVLSTYLLAPLVQLIYSVGQAAWPQGPGLAVRQWPAWAQFLLAFLIQDLLRYASHRLRHEVRWLWHFHAIHHSQTQLNPGTTHRAHPCEALVGTALMTLPIGLIGVEPVPWLYAGITSLFWDLFIHSNTRTNLGWLGRVLASPQHHRVHHSALPEHFDRNYGERLLLWDWLFGTLSPDRHSYPPTGCAESARLMEQPGQPLWLPRAWLRQLAYPFQRIAEDLTRRPGTGPLPPPSAPNP